MTTGAMRCSRARRAVPLAAQQRDRSLGDDIAAFRTLFIAPESEEREVRTRIRSALRSSAHGSSGPTGSAPLRPTSVRLRRGLRERSNSRRQGPRSPPDLLRRARRASRDDVGLCDSCVRRRRLSGCQMAWSPLARARPGAGAFPGLGSGCGLLPALKVARLAAVAHVVVGAVHRVSHGASCLHSIG